MRLFLKSVLLEGRNVQELLTADYTFVNERLARHYGIDGIVGPQFRRVALADPVRHGLLGKGSMLLRTSYGDRTSPVLRGAWVLDKLMGTPPTPPPPGVETNLEHARGRAAEDGARAARAAPQGRELQRVPRRHRPVRLGARELHGDRRVARLTTRTPNAPIDPRAELSGGRPVDGPVALRAALLERDDQFVQALTEKLMMYAIGRELEYYDMPQVRAVVRAAKREDYRFSALVAGIVQSDAFRMQAVRREAESVGSAQASLGAAGQQRRGVTPCS